MQYRPEIDGLRAIAVISVACFHAGFGLFGGGFVGVDVFFAISGYLITTRIVEDLEDRKFKLTHFYERRVRRLLPVLFVVMAVSSIVAEHWMLPNDLSNFGQSLLATSLFMNNVLLLNTSGYWSLPSEFKPLLHTWSLSIEEQYYIVFPVLMLAGWRSLRSRFAVLLVVLTASSLAVAHWMSTVDREIDFFLPPMRAWEFLSGGLVALWLRWRPPIDLRDGCHQSMSAIGLSLLVFSIVCFDQRFSAPSLYTVIPVCGAVLILMCAREGTIAFRILSRPILVRIGLISYSFYLWHQPVIAFARIYSVDAPPLPLVGALLVLSIPVAYLSWRFIEQPFRSQDFVGSGVVIGGSILLSIVFIIHGAFLYFTRGIPSRLYAREVAADDLYIGYNARVFEFKRDAFVRQDALHVLVVGNSFARDFVNMITETYGIDRIEIVYRDSLQDCLGSWLEQVSKSLLDNASIIIFASSSINYGCVDRNIHIANMLGKRVFYVGGKHFGYNLNWLARLGLEKISNQSNNLLPGTVNKESKDRSSIPRDHFISILVPIAVEGRIPITDERGRLLSVDRTHLTRYGAKYLGERVLPRSQFEDALPVTLKHLR